MLKNKSFVIGLLSFGVLYFGSSEIYPESQELTSKQEIELEHVIDTIRKERETLGKSLNDHTKIMDAYKEARDAISIKSEDEAFGEYFGEAFGGFLEQAFGEYFVEFSERAFEEYFAESLEQAEEGSLEERLKEIEDKVFLDMKHFFAPQKEYLKSIQIFLNSLDKSLVISKKVIESKKELWTNLNTLLEVFSQSLETSTRIFKINEQQKFVKDCFKIAHKLKKITRKHKKYLDIVNKKRDVFRSKIGNINELLKMTLFTLNEREKTWVAFIQSTFSQSQDARESHSEDVVEESGEAMYEVLKSLRESEKSMQEVKKEFGNVMRSYEVFSRKEIKEVDQLEKLLKEGLVEKINTTFQFAIQSVGKEPMAQDMYQEASKAYEEIEKFWKSA